MHGKKIFLNPRKGEWYEFMLVGMCVRLYISNQFLLEPIQ